MANIFKPNVSYLSWHVSLKDFCLAQILNGCLMFVYMNLYIILVESRCLLVFIPTTNSLGSCKALWLGAAGAVDINGLSSSRYSPQTSFWIPRRTSTGQPLLIFQHFSSVDTRHS